MEVEVLKGAAKTIQQYKPIALIEIIKSDRIALEKFMNECGYKLFEMGINLLAIHETDPTLQHISNVNNQIILKL